MEEKIIGASTSPYAWNYPPFFLLMILPLSLLPYLASLIVWLFTTLAGYLLTIRRIVPHRLAPWIFLGFPAVTTNFFYGQNGFLSATLLGGGLVLLERRLYRRIVAWPAELQAPISGLDTHSSGGWRLLEGFGWGRRGRGGSGAGQSLCFRPRAWMAFWHNLSFAPGLMDNSIYWSKMPTVFAACRLAGAGFPVAIALQGVSPWG